MIWLLLGSAMILFGLLIIVCLAFWLWSLYDITRRDTDAQDKLAWSLIVVFTYVFGSIAYLIFSHMLKKELILNKNKKLMRSKEKVIAGVCGGLAEFFEVDPTIIRIAWVFVTFLTLGTGLVAYFTAWMVMPEN
jgi:phage shock protein C